MNEEIYELLEKEFRKNRVKEEVEDVLLELAETIQEEGVVGKDIICKLNYSRTVIEGCGFVELVEETDDEASVFLKWVKIGGNVIEIEDYFL